MAIKRYLARMWQTCISLDKSQHQFDHKDQILTIGSCFADEMGQRLRDLSFRTEVNPFGILYNPVSIARIFSHLQDSSTWKKEGAFCLEDRWRHFDFSSQVSATSEDAFHSLVWEKLKKIKNHVGHCSLILCTLGTSFVWENLTGHIVANCHKLPEKNFHRRLLSPEEIRHALTSILNHIHTLNPNCHVVFTVSPIRHLRDGAINNNWSKSRLIDGCHTLMAQSNRISYFPSYEIVHDELRDYRFYKEDMTHPSEAAVDYIHERFMSTYFRQLPHGLLNQLKKLNTLKKHKVRSHATQACHQDKIKKLTEIIHSEFNVTIDVNNN